jgi:hypothetical protein
MKLVPAVLTWVRMLTAACAAAAVCLMVFVTMSSSAQAHAGHKHRASEQTAAKLTDAPAAEQMASPLQIAEAQVSRGAVGHAFNADMAAHDTARVLLVDAPKGACTCGGLCGSCTSASCCVAVVAGQGSVTVPPRGVSTRVTVTALRISGTAVLPLQRPPIRTC